MQVHNEQSLQDVLSASLRAVDPGQAVRAHVGLSGDTLRIGDASYRLSDIDRILVVGGGKAGAPMAIALLEVLGDRISDGLVSVKYGHVTADEPWRVRFERRSGDVRTSQSDRAREVTGARRSIRVAEAGHPFPDAAGMSAASAIRDLVGSLSPRDLLLVVLSGGASALLPLPASGINLEDLRRLTEHLLRSGAEINEVNAVRKHCSRIAGGQLARLAMPARVATLILSDVVGNPLESIGSGPTVPDPTTFADAVAVLERYRIRDVVPRSVSDHLERGAAGILPDTPKPGDPLFDRVTHIIVGDNGRAAQAAVQQSRRLGWHSALLTTFLQGEAREVGRVAAALAQGIARDQAEFSSPVCLVLGGETTVTIRGNGLGGRNQELALAAAIALDQYPLPAKYDVSVIALATDGTDGPTDAAGGRATGDSMQRARSLGLDAPGALANNDSYHLLGAMGDLLITGPTQTNVNDLILVAVLP